MAYVEGGTIKSRRSVFRLSTFSDLFWGIISLIQAFFKTMFSLEASNSYGKKRSDGNRASRFGGGWGGGGGGGGGGPSGGPGRGPGSNGGPRGMSNVRGIDHNSLPACGSCCGG